VSLLNWELAIEERLINGDASVPGFGAANVFIEAVPDEVPIPRDQRQVKPYVVVWFGQRIRGNDGYRGICGVKGNASRANLLVMACAHVGTVQRGVVAQVSDLLHGFRPAGQGELEETSSTTIRRPLDISGVVGRIAVPVAFSGTVDL
jgi:hypothetical protein